MSPAIAPIVAFYDHALQPISALAWLGAPISALDIAGALRLALILRQQREIFRKEHLAKTPSTTLWVKDARSSEKAPAPTATLTVPLEPRSRVRDLAASLVMVFGGEAVVAPWLGLQPTFFVSGAVPLLYLGASALVDSLSAVPELSLFTELPLSVLDALTRAILLCNFVPVMITAHGSLAVSSSPYTLLLTAFIVANAGPFFVNTFSLLQPTPITTITPPELLPYGWTATDLWVAPLVAGLYATLTHSQPFFARLHALLFSFFSPLGLAQLSFQHAKLGNPDVEGMVVPLEASHARAVCVLVLAALFGLRAVRAFGSGIARAEPPRSGTALNMLVVNANDEKELEREVAARVAGAGKGYARMTPSSSPGHGDFAVDA